MRVFLISASAGKVPPWRNDVRRLNNTVEVELKVKGLAFNQVDTAAFRATLKRAGFYKDWKAKYGAEAWAILEKSVGKLG